MVYNTDVASSSNQLSEIDLLTQILTAAQALSTGEGSESSLLTSILAALAPLATAAKQDTGNASLASIDGKLSSSAASIASVSQSTSSQVLIAANPNRRGIYFYNNSGQKLFLAFAATASASAFTVLLAANAGYEGTQTVVYKGQISGIWSGAGSGAVLVTELT